jgi:FlaA1/EpsC-like NDP-sugar epimerase
MTSQLTERELHQLLGRPVRAELEPADREMFAGRRVLVTGAGGSIGSELARQIAACGPAHLALVDRSEYQLFQIDRELRASARDLEITPWLTDIARSAHVQRVFAQVRPDIVYHAAAYKHVPMAERAIAVAAETNVLGTAIVAAQAAASGARFVLISSDKAASPQGVMGATKRLAELVVLSRATPVFRPAIVRFGNVLGSSGSVVELMRDAVHRGLPIPITDPTATRFFMTAGEAVALVVRADRLAADPHVFWLDMGDPVRIGDLAERLLAVEAARGYQGAGVDIIGLRPGEKLHEQLTDADMVFHRTTDRRIWRAQHRLVDRVAIDAWLGLLRVAADRADDGAALAVLTHAVAGFRPGRTARAAAGWLDDDTRRKDGRAA